jgi:LemA protein
MQPIRSIFNQETSFMKKPWLIFAGLCTVVLAIVMICVIFGSYTSMLRSKNRVQTGKGLMITACENQLEKIPGLLSLAPGTDTAPIVSRIQDTMEQIRPLLARFQTSDTPLDPDLISLFEQAQSRLAEDLDTLARDIGTSHPRVQELTDLYLNTIYAAGRYNKEVTYFHGRKKLFPGMFTAKWFHLDDLHFPLIDITCFDPWGLK